ncbi:MAG: PucR family transcriptional regulator [Pseudomonadota bacterium]
MTQVITRYFDSVQRARDVKFELVRRRRLPQKAVRLLDAPEGVSEILTDMGVKADTAAAYATKLANGGAVVWVRASYQPLGVAQITRDVFAEMGAVDLGDIVEEVEIDDFLYKKSSVYEDHPLLLTRIRDPWETDYHMADWPIPLISRREPYTGSVVGHSHMANWPIPLLSRHKPYSESMIPRHGRMANFPIPLISKRKPYTRSIFPRHARMANWPFGLLSKRKPYTGTLIARHARMANWPFPHLINGKRGTNSLMPKAPRMANFPIPLLSKRKPLDKFLFPRHARMANFPIPLLSDRKPYDESIFPKHQRMADFPIPLLAKDAVPDMKDGTVSGMFGIPTIIRR